MLLHIRRTAVGVAVTSFFGISLIGWISGISPFVCCKRALAGAGLAYVATVLAVKAINSVLLRAIITDQANREEEADSAGRD